MHIDVHAVSIVDQIDVLNCIYLEDRTAPPKNCFLFFRALNLVVVQ